MTSRGCSLRHTAIRGLGQREEDPVGQAEAALPEVEEVAGPDTRMTRGGGMEMEEAHRGIQTADGLVVEEMVVAAGADGLAEVGVRDQAIPAILGGVPGVAQVLERQVVVIRGLEVEEEATVAAGADGLGEGEVRVAMDGWVEAGVRDRATLMIPGGGMGMEEKEVGVGIGVGVGMGMENLTMGQSVMTDTKAADRSRGATPRTRSKPAG